MVGAGRKGQPHPQQQAGPGQADPKQDVKKSSYYVWFLGAKESKGLRGEEFIQPVVRYLTSKASLQYSTPPLQMFWNIWPAERCAACRYSSITVLSRAAPPHHVLHDCTVQEKEQPPIKVTLQLSHKGLKIVQNVPGKRAHETYRVN